MAGVRLPNDLSMENRQERNFSKDSVHGRDANQDSLQAASMSSFIRNQIKIMMQPFLDHVESNDKRIDALEDLVEAADDRITGNFQELDATKTTLTATVENLRLTDRRVEALGADVQRCAERMDHLQRGVQVASEHTERVETQVRSVSSETPALRRSCDDLRTQLQALHTEYNRLAGISDGVVKTRLDSLTEEIADLKVKQEKSESAAEKLYGEVVVESRLLHDTRQELHSTNSSLGAAQQTQRDMIMREKEFERRLEAFNAQWNKLQPVVDGLKKDAAFLKQTAESHDASIHGVQRGQQNLTECVDSLHAAHAKMSVELDAAQRALKQTSQAVAVTQDNLGQNASFANNLHSRIDRAAAELSSTTGQLRALEGKHEALSDVVDKAVEKQGQLVSESRKEAQEVARVQRCLDTTNDSMASMAKQLEVMNRGLNGFKGELGFATDRVTKTEHSVKELYGAWHGLQKGFVDSGQDMGPSLASKRTGRLPKVGSPSAGSTMAGTPRTRDRLAFFPGGDGTTSQEAWGASPMSSRAVTKDSC